jgi:hypothetical protein
MACKVLAPIAPPPPEHLGWVTMDEFMNVYEGSRYDAACNHMPKAGAAGWLTPAGGGARAGSEFLRGQRVPAASCAIDAFSQRPLSRASRPFIGLICDSSRWLLRHGTSRLPQVEGEASPNQGLTFPTLQAPA